MGTEKNFFALEQQVYLRKIQTSLISTNWLIYILEQHNDFHNSASAASSNIF
jgi:hypothetical protein